MHGRVNFEFVIRIICQLITKHFRLFLTMDTYDAAVRSLVTSSYTCDRLLRTIHIRVDGTASVHLRQGKEE